MEGVKNYLLSVTAVSLICGILNTLTGKKTATSNVIRLLTGLLLALSVIRPVVNFSISDIEQYVGSISMDAESAILHGENLAFSEMKTIIKAETEAYILDKAALLGVDLEVEVILSETAPPLPEGVVLTGAAAPYTKARLSTFLEEELGIPKEAQQWTG